MMLVDSSIWVDHFRAVDQMLQTLLNEKEVLGHPFVTGEILMGNLRNWAAIREMLCDLQPAVVADDAEVLDFVRQHSLYGTGIGYVDAHLLTSAKLTSDATIWSRDRRLALAASRLGLASSLPGVQ
jgi:predicted nucleic acid-binding protein